MCSFPVPSKVNQLLWLWCKVEGCIGILVSRVQNLAAVGGKTKIAQVLQSRDLPFGLYNMVSTNEVEKKIKTGIYITKTKQGKSDLWWHLDKIATPEQSGVG